LTIAFSDGAETRQQQLFESVFQQAPDAILILDSTSRVVRVNARAERLFRLDEHELCSTPLRELLPSDHAYTGPTFPASETGLYSGGLRAGSWSSILRQADGSHTPVLISVSAIASDDKALWIAVVREQTEFTWMPQGTVPQVLHDSLTGLPNRDLFMDRLRRAVGRARRHADYAFAMLLLDLDRFQVVNGSLGHAIGDDLLRAVALRLEDCARSVDTIARLGGDEFAILLDDLRDPSQAVRVADRLISEISAPFKLRGQDVYTSASIGIALSASGYEHESDVLRDADTAMYRAKALGKARHEMFDSEMHTRALKLLQTEAELRQAIDHGQFRVFYQPIIHGSDCRFVGFEALVRWEHPTRGLVSPLEFIPVAEDTGLIVPIGGWVLREACSQLKSWHDAGYRSLRMAVNCSARQFEQPGFDQLVMDTIQSAGVSPEHVELEITEGVIMRNVGAGLARLDALREHGIRISVDDFGTGYSALGYLKDLPLSSLKIDRSFMCDAVANASTAAIVDAIVVLAHNLRLNVIAEGVETSEQLEYLRSVGCDEYQGFLVSRPVPADQAFALLAANQSQPVSLTA
jgi:diguanylate cyclase (GGDEF)-like protein/PAS domain S-box-containing protein